MIYKNGIQNIPVSDSPNNDAFEAVVELYYQLKGYITCSGKWYWYAEKGKQQRGYQDFDVLAINSKETVIVSVSSNLDDKVSFNRNGKINKDKLNKLKKYFEHSEKYLKNVPEYKRLTKNGKIKRVVAYLSFQKKKLNEIKKIMKKKEIELLSSEDIVKCAIDYLENNKNLKVQNHTLRMLQVLKDNKCLVLDKSNLHSI